ncbi:MAG: FumA C-terminus/TtdB family hydratase beta subunit [Defluviitaleaceae bacterium]|nr:FumA C-terminus/TtdB family hydratase beta subunit [Defluviitaleaceae bacterium]MCL2239644.1 FumA C-terminus/TtdB family hydratase beta subunit [Defluviitaleaceae bacterium]
MEIFTPLTAETIEKLRAGDTVLLSGVIYTARDAAHARMAEALRNKKEPPMDYAGQVVFYAGPCPAPPGKPVGSIGPTTAGRMDAYAPALIAAGLKAMIGKGERSRAVTDAIKAHKGIYFAAVGGVAALLAKCVRSSQRVAYDDLGTEAIHKLTVEKFPLIVATDCTGESVYL